MVNCCCSCLRRYPPSAPLHATVTPGLCLALSTAALSRIVGQMRAKWRWILMGLPVPGCCPPHPFSSVSQGAAGCKCAQGCHFPKPRGFTSDLQVAACFHWFQRKLWRLGAGASYVCRHQHYTASAWISDRSCTACMATSKR